MPKARWSAISARTVSVPHAPKWYCSWAALKPKCEAHGGVDVARPPRCSMTADQPQDTLLLHGCVCRAQSSEELAAGPHLPCYTSAQHPLHVHLDQAECTRVHNSDFCAHHKANAKLLLCSGGPLQAAVLASATGFPPNASAVQTSAPPPLPLRSSVALHAKTKRSPCPPQPAER